MKRIAIGLAIVACVLVLVFLPVWLVPWIVGSRFQAMASDAGIDLHFESISYNYRELTIRGLDIKKESMVRAQIPLLHVDTTLWWVKGVRGDNLSIDLSGSPSTDVNAWLQDLRTRSKSSPSLPIELRGHLVWTDLGMGPVALKFEDISIVRKDGITIDLKEGSVGVPIYSLGPLTLKIVDKAPTFQMEFHYSPARSGDLFVSYDAAAAKQTTTIRLASFKFPPVSTLPDLPRNLTYDGQWVIEDDGRQITTKGSIKASGASVTIQPSSVPWIQPPAGVSFRDLSLALPELPAVTMPIAIDLGWQTHPGSTPGTHAFEATDAVVTLRDEKIHASISGSLAWGPTLGAPHPFKLVYSVGPLKCAKVGTILLGELGANMSGNLSAEGEISGDLLNPAGIQNRIETHDRCSFALGKFPSLPGIQFTR